MPQLKIDRWVQNKPPFLAMLCQQMASFADNLHEILSFAKQQEHIPNPPEAIPKNRNHRLLEKRFLGALLDQSPWLSAL